MTTGFFIASSPLGYLLSLVLSGISLPLGGYKLSFLATCLGPLLGAVFSWTALATTRPTVVQRHKQQKFSKEVLGNRPARLLISSYTAHTWELLGMWSWTPAFLASCLALRGAQGLSAAGVGAYLTATLHLAGLIASSSMGSLSDRLGRARVIIILSVISAACSFLFGWTIGWPVTVIIAIGLLYAFSSLGDSPVLSAALTEVVTPSYLGAAFGLRSLLGFGAGALAPLAFGAVLDWSNPLGAGMGYYRVWGWAFGVLGLGGLGAAWFAHRLRGIT